MKKPVLAFDSTLRRKALRSLFLICLGSFIAASLAVAQEKAATSPHAAGWVVLPINEYRVLRAKAYPTEPVPEPPPLDATLTRVDYDLRVAGDLAAGRETHSGRFEGRLGTGAGTSRIAGARCATGWQGAVAGPRRQGQGGHPRSGLVVACGTLGADAGRRCAGNFLDWRGDALVAVYRLWGDARGSATCSPGNRAARWRWIAG